MTNDVYHNNEYRLRNSGSKKQQMTNDVYHNNEYRLRNSGSKKQQMTKTKEPKTLSSEELQRSIVGIHAIASRRTPPTNVDSFEDRAAFLTIIDECVRCIPELKGIGGAV